MEFLKVQLMHGKNIEIGLYYDVPHISTYVLTVEPKTALKKLIEKNKIKEVEDRDQKLQFEYAYDLFLKLGYYNYEFSSFSKPGYECKNNLHIGTGKNILGLGHQHIRLMVPQEHGMLVIIRSILKKLKKIFYPMNQRFYHKLMC